MTTTKQTVDVAHLANEEMTLMPMPIKDFAHLAHKHLIDHFLQEISTLAQAKDVAGVYDFSYQLMQLVTEQRKLASELGTLTGLFSIRVDEADDGFFVVVEREFNYPGDYFDSTKAGKEAPYTEPFEFHNVLRGIYSHDNGGLYSYPTKEAAASYAGAFVKTLEDCGYEVLVNYGVAEEPEERVINAVRSHMEDEYVKMMSLVTNQEIEELKYEEQEESEQPPAFTFNEALEKMEKENIKMGVVFGEYDMYGLEDGKLYGYWMGTKKPQPLNQAELLRIQENSWYEVKQ